MRIKDEDIKINIPSTFGTLKFMGLARISEEYVYDEEEDRRVSTGELLDRRYEVRSSVQRDYFQVIVPPNVELDLPMNSEVELINPAFNGYTLARGNRGEGGIRVLAENIVPKRGGLPKKEEPKKENDKQG
ncbi:MULTISPECIES: DUF961 family protein [unclassified Enterococcus]|uniref:DUF961 family protein n=1 Tax=unclassified Enterococcus TaxID=2608891 RepID=UPI00190826A7|nr:MULTISPECIES: DUF961 family protein [unclassified Enterococcus]MBK0036039.1 DUF961 family protein [Enterococcus sp. S52]MBK0068697.1 DUF961 family protein [Enterococcus sp. S53]MBK0139290.1 DUF961 family protein [Enterococcus sp. S76]MBK0142925.1 DUF961 family protein [Enterococcus sp. S77]